MVKLATSWIGRKALILLATNFCLFASAQEIEGEHFLTTPPDTIQFYYPAKTFVSSLDSLQHQIIDSIKNPLCYLLNTRTTGTGYQCLLALKTKQGFFLVNPFEHSIAYADAYDIQLERVDFDSKGNLELLLTWEFYAGHSGWNNSVHEHDAGMQLWNLDNIIRYADFQTYYHFEHWWTNYEEDPMDTIATDEPIVLNSGSEFECERIDYQIKNKKLLLSFPYRCYDEAEDGSLTNLNEYRLSKKTLIKK